MDHWTHRCCGFLAAVATLAALGRTGAAAQGEPSAASCPPGWLPTFGGEPGANSTVFALVVYDDGGGPALHAGGQFTSAGGVITSRIAKWDGSTWAPLGSGTNGSVFALAVYDDGGGPALYAGGDFTGAGGVVTRGIARWNGSSWASPGGGMNASVYSLTVYDDGSGPALYAGGRFNVAGGVAANRIAKWNGASWAPLGSGVSGGASTNVLALAVHDDGFGPALYAGGTFTIAGGVAASRIAKWDGTSWTALGSGIGAVYHGSDSIVRALSVYDDGFGPALFVGGGFGTAGGVTANQVAKWNGSGWSAAGSGMADGDAVDVLAVFDDGSGSALHAGGAFTSAGGVPANYIAKWNGSSWSALGSGMGASSSVASLAVFDAGGGPALYAGGPFTSAGGVAASYVARWQSSSWSALGNGMNSWVDSLTTHDDGSGAALYAGGRFTSVSGVPANRIAKWDGSSWSPLGSGTSDRVLALTVYDDGGGPALHAGGAFTTAGGVTVNCTAKWDGSSWSPLGSGIGGGAFPAILSLVVHDDGGGPALYAGGGFTQAGGLPVSSIARWDGASWSGLGSGTNGGVHALTAFDDGGGPALYAGGSFTTAGGVSANRIARWDGASWSPLGSGMNFPVYALAVYDDGGGPALYAGGYFDIAGGVTVNHIAKWDGSSWTPLGGGILGQVKQVDALVVYDDGGGPALYAGGNFGNAGGVVTKNIARWDGSSWSALGSGMNALSVLALVVHDDGGGSALYAGGQFTSCIDSGDSFLAKWGYPVDLEPPVLSCPPSVFALDDLGTPAGEVVSFSVTASDCRDPAPTVVCIPPSGSSFPRGTTLVTCTATDASGNQSTCEFPVTVSPKARRR